MEEIPQTNTKYMHEKVVNHLTDLHKYHHSTSLTIDGLRQNGLKAMSETKSEIEGLLTLLEGKSTAKFVGCYID